MGVCLGRTSKQDEETTTLQSPARTLFEGQADILLDTQIRIDPYTTFGLWEGWGVSLAWWANVFGQDDTLADLAFTTAPKVSIGLPDGHQHLPGLGFTIVRYNLGGCSSRPIGGDCMSISPHVPNYKQIQGFWIDWASNNPASASWDWTVDANQIAMLTKAKVRGADRLEIFSNSPMWWMCKNQNPAGGGDNNLQDWNFRSFAQYLATVVKRFKDDLGIQFTSVEPFNEPSTHWSKDGIQEGCHFDPALQAWIVGCLAEELRARHLDAVALTASDEWGCSKGLKSWNDFKSAPTPNGTCPQKLVEKVNVHGYEYDSMDRASFYHAVAGRKLWLSEYGDWDGSGIDMAKRITLDLKWLRPTAWCYWQLVDETIGWGLLRGRLNSEAPALVSVEKKYFVMAHYTRHLRPGMCLIRCEDALTIAAYNARKHVLTLVTVVPIEVGHRRLAIDLSQFKAADGPVTEWVTDKSQEYVERRHVPGLQEGVLVVSVNAPSVHTIEVQHTYM
eukprot:TRINITY_DN37618_c0_g1_i1.p1 TRINITY_DN37618_c0_g1~~TRINITY_DN37618_c0_g1_i1.p1  ORF type:complete len:503 (-),score=75.38 TRINITY_DN37618_c0_g1_i1:63-1571(-)